MTTHSHCHPGQGASISCLNPVGIAKEVSHLMGYDICEAGCKSAGIRTQGPYLITEYKGLIFMVKITPVYLFCQTEK